MGKERKVDPQLKNLKLLMRKVKGTEYEKDVQASIDKRTAEVERPHTEALKNLCLLLETCIPK